MKPLVLVLAVTAIAHAQTPAERPEFEVASVKLSADCGQRGNKGSPPTTGRLHIGCTTVQNLIRNAYVQFADGVSINMKMIEINGGPEWIRTDRYDITAKASDAAPVGRMFGPMMQMLLESRFQLKIHRETKEGPVYNLTVAKGGLKLQPTPEGTCVPMDLDHMPPPPAPGQPRPTFCGSVSMRSNPSGISLTGNGTTMAILAGIALPGMVHRPVIDKTGFTGQFELQLDLAADNMLPAMGGAPVPVADAPTPSIFQALQRLGLKLEPGKGPVDILVIDHVERPSEN